MAGRPGYAKQLVAMEKELEAVKTERDRLKKILIGIDPSYLEVDKPPPLTEYDEDIVIPRLMAMADMGMGEDQWVGEFGLSRKEWAKWKNQHPELVDAVDRGLQAALAWWQESARKANENNSKFGISAYKMRIAELEEGMTEMAAADIGDASQLVLLDLRRDPKLDKLAAERAENQA